MTRPAGQGEGCGTSGREPGRAATHCSFCGRPADARTRRGAEVFCSEDHADAFAREVAVTRASTEARR